jgi:hypothetical protein
MGGTDPVASPSSTLRKPFASEQLFLIFLSFWRPPVTSDLPEMQGDAEAVRYAQDHCDSIRRIISGRLGARLRQVFATSDVYQSLMRVLLERPKPPQPLAKHELDRVVTVIAVRLVRAKARAEHHSRWDMPQAAVERESDPAADPAEQAAARDFLETVRALAGQDWPLLEARLEGRTFTELADSFHSTPDALRMRWNRVLDRITQQMKGDADE